ncbi:MULTISPECIES: hypothetical protein [Cysteiniphilum]|uniref:hypothetical protein n=1 Tax=Cysteiniphilum TaxID=2056696 RepID=UPI00177AF713|nr:MULTISPECIES: hypothetical protein [Cysteiniphilum]
MTVLTQSVFANAVYASSASPVDHLIELLAKRSSLMKEVAIAKAYAAQQKGKYTATAYDAKQEVRVLAAAKQAASDCQLEPLPLYAFTQLQMDVAKQIEAYWIGLLKGKSIQAPSPEHTLTALRIELQGLNAKIYIAIKQSMYVLNVMQFDRLVNEFKIIFLQVCPFIKNTGLIDAKGYVSPLLLSYIKSLQNLKLRIHTDMIKISSAYNRQ